ncbi:MAG: hypothetical protein ABJC62_05100 [Frankiaceae bacterium]
MRLSAVNGSAVAYSSVGGHGRAAAPEVTGGRGRRGSRTPAGGGAPGPRRGGGGADVRRSRSSIQRAGAVSAMPTGCTTRSTPRGSLVRR